MKVMIFGATGRTGQQLVLQALALGHDVTAVVRDPARLPSRFDRLHVVKGDALTPASFAAAMQGQEAVLSSLGVSGFLNSLRPMSFYEQSTRSIVEVMRANSVSRFVGAGSVGVLSRLSAPLWYRAIVKPLLRHKYADMKRMETFLAGSDLDWTVARGSQLVEGPLTQTYRVGADGHLADIGKLSFADLADFIVRQLGDDRYSRRAVAVSY